MHIILFTHPPTLSSQSMPRFASLICNGMRERGHLVELMTAQPLVYSLPVRARLKKWLGYIDQFIIFPRQLKSRLKRLPENVLFVFADQALCPWLPVIRHRPHLIHVHDFMALRSALGQFPSNPVSWSGKIYQSLIRRGFRTGIAFVSISRKTQEDLHSFLRIKPVISEMVHIGLNFPFHRMTPSKCWMSLGGIASELHSGFLLHVGGNQWYKNRAGVLEIYESYVSQTEDALPLWMVGAAPTAEMKAIADRASARGKVYFLDNLSDEQVCAAYSSAQLLIFPSIAEGFGWPIAEAMACGCPVLTTDEAPMTEVGGDAAFYIPSKSGSNESTWARDAARYVISILLSSATEKAERQKIGVVQAASFDTKGMLDTYERIYRDALETQLALRQ